MPKDNGKRDTQRTETGYEIPVPKRSEVMDVFRKATRKRSRKRDKGSTERRRS
jgi:hypothetical protein